MHTCTSRPPSHVRLTPLTRCLSCMSTKMRPICAVIRFCAQAANRAFVARTRVQELKELAKEEDEKRKEQAALEFSVGAVMGSARAS